MNGMEFADVNNKPVFKYDILTRYVNFTRLA